MVPLGLTHFSITLFPIYSAQTLQKHPRIWNFGIKVFFFPSLCASCIVLHRDAYNREHEWVGSGGRRFFERKPRTK